MRNHDYELDLQLVPVVAEEALDIPLDLSDLIAIGQAYSELPWYMRNQVETITSCGIQEAIDSGEVSINALPHIKSFLQVVIRNPYFGDAADQATSCVRMIEAYEDTHPILQLAN